MPTTPPRPAAPVTTWSDDQGSRGMSDERCAACGTAFTYRAKPRWSFTPEGRPAGKVHAAPCIPGRNRTHVTMSHAAPLERAQFDFWLIYARPREESHTTAWYAEVLAEGPSETLSERQERQLRWWVERENDPLSSEQIQAVHEAHAALVREFRVWQAGLEAMAYRGACS